jgi:hypothetical protein
MMNIADDEAKAASFLSFENIMRSKYESHVAISWGAKKNFVRQKKILRKLDAICRKKNSGNCQHMMTKK